MTTITLEHEDDIIMLSAQRCSDGNGTLSYLFFSEEFVDIQRAKAIAENGNFKGRSKHFELRWRFLHHYILRGVVTIKAIKRDLQLADIGTAPRPHPQLHSMGRVVHGEC